MPCVFDDRKDLMGGVRLCSLTKAGKRDKKYCQGSFIVSLCKHVLWPALD